uniref:Uncharacterized protein n=1 Tax=Amphilophus citrinellus TaxID=61819 RepID=A0A3Q0RUI9_AMPCI
NATAAVEEAHLERFYIEACDDGSVDVLAIDRVSTEMTLTVITTVTRPICGLMGTIRLVAVTRGTFYPVRNRVTGTPPWSQA